MEVVCDARGDGGDAALPRRLPVAFMRHASASPTSPRSFYDALLSQPHVVSPHCLRDAPMSSPRRFPTLFAHMLGTNIHGEHCGPLHIGASA
eukprot:360819-Chlamydomonas_euryale.AAC.7